MPQIWTFELSLFQKPYSLGFGRRLTCLCCVGEFSKKSETISFRCLFVREKSSHIFQTTIRYHIITSSHHLIPPEEWSFPFRNGWTSDLAASDLSQYHYWGRGPWWQWGGFFSYIFCYETNEKIKLMIVSQITNENWTIWYSRVAWEWNQRFCQTFVLTTTVMWCGV